MSLCCLCFDGSGVEACKSATKWRRMFIFATQVAYSKCDFLDDDDDDDDDDCRLV